MLDGVSLETLDNLLDAGLLASMGQGRYTIHETIVDFARCQDTQAKSVTAMPPQVRVLRQLRERATRAVENPSRQGRPLDEVLPALTQRADEAVRFSSS